MVHVVMPSDMATVCVLVVLQPLRRMSRSRAPMPPLMPTVVRALGQAQQVRAVREGDGRLLVSCIAGEVRAVARDSANRLDDPIGRHADGREHVANVALAGGLIPDPWTLAVQFSPAPGEPPEPFGS